SIRAVEAKLKQVTPQVRFKFQIFDEQLTVERHYERAFRNTVTTVSLATLIIALMGLIGYVNDEIRRRTKEIAIRKVNGATARDIQRLILHDLSVITLPAILLGITSAYLFSREWLMRFNDRITLHWWIFAVGALFVAVIVACVALWQTHRSAHGDPIKMIRTE
ncbi:ABC transporter permease, partial [Alistipes indistinctus]